MHTKTVSQLDADGFLVGPASADESPLEPGIFLLPAGCIDVPPIDVPAGKRAKYESVGFVLEEIPSPPADPVPDFAQLKAAETAIWKSVREPYFGRLASIASRLRNSGDVPGADSADAVADSLLGLFTDPAVEAASDITAYKSALKARYQQAIGLATSSAKAEFKKYDK